MSRPTYNKGIIISIIPLLDLSLGGRLSFFSQIGTLQLTLVSPLHKICPNYTFIALKIEY